MSCWCSPIDKWSKYINLLILITLYFNSIFSFNNIVQTAITGILNFCSTLQNNYEYIDKINHVLVVNNSFVFSVQENLNPASQKGNVFIPSNSYSDILSLKRISMALREE